MSTTPPLAIAIPPPPPLDSSDVSVIHQTNTLALLLPHLALFHPPILSLLRAHYAQFGPLAHWAPVRAFGRVIVVYEKLDDASRAKREGDWLSLGLNVGDLEALVGKEGGQADGDGSHAVDEARDAIHGGEDGAQHGNREEDRMNGSSSHDDGAQSGQGYFSPRRRRRKTQDRSKPLVLRLHPLPLTPLHSDSSTSHLKPPESQRNFLISPPGSPPEGWEPIVEDAPNVSTLADDLQRALEALQLRLGDEDDEDADEGGDGYKERGGPSRSRRHARGKSVVFDEGGVRVEVEDCTGLTDLQALGGGARMRADNGGEQTIGGEEEWERARGVGMWDIEERIQGGAEAYRVPSQEFGNGQALANNGGLGGLSGLGSAARMHIAPTARPPI